jgi:hypothetical protein
MVVHTCNPSTQRDEAGRWVPGQPELQSEAFLKQNTATTSTNPESNSRNSASVRWHQAAISTLLTKGEIVVSELVHTVETGEMNSWCAVLPFRGLGLPLGSQMKKPDSSSPHSIPTEWPGGGLHSPGKAAWAELILCSLLGSQRMSTWVTLTSPAAWDSYGELSR